MERDTYGYGYEEQEDIIPGDNDRQSNETWPGYPNAPVNLTRLPDNLLPKSLDIGGDPN